VVLLESTGIRSANPPDSTVELTTKGNAKLYVAVYGARQWAGNAIKAAVISLLFVDMRGGSLGFPTYKISAIPITKTE
jgi:hypothetical protein